MSRFEPQTGFYTLLMKGIFDAYVLLPFEFVTLLILATLRKLLYTYDTQRYWVHFFVQKTKKMIWKKRNSMKGLISVHFFYIKRPHNVECHMYKVTK